MWLPLIIGCVGFVLYILYDINSYTIKNPVLDLGFLVGSLLIAAATLWQIVSAVQQHAVSGVVDIILIVLAIAAFGALVYCLFFALPFGSTYTDTSKERETCEVGVYALCRHPGVICFFVMYLLLGIAALPSPLLINGMIYSVLNLLYVVFQDLVTFPKTLNGYSNYRKKVPFLIPTKQSIRCAVQTLRRHDRKEDGK